MPRTARKPKSGQRTAQIKTSPLSFYGRGNLVQIKDGKNIHFFAATVSDRANAEWFKLNGCSHAIHAANKACGLNLTEKNVLDYLRFFCDFLDMKDGQRMQITGDTVCWFSRTNIVQSFRPTMDGMRDGNFLCTAHAVYAGSVFKTAFSIQPDGCLEMLWSKPIEPATVH